MSDYKFITIWRFDAPLEPVWNCIRDSENWSQWWKGILRVVELQKGQPDGVGAIYRSTWKSALPYTLEFDSEIMRIEPMKLIEARAFGELEGYGIWHFSQENEQLTRVEYEWKVKTTKAWMNFLAPIARPFFRWNHDYIMNAGGKGMAQKLNCQLLK